MYGLLGVGIPTEEKQRTKIFFLILCEGCTECFGDLRQVSQVKTYF